MLNRYNEIWNKISNLLKRGSDSEPVHNKKHIKTKIKNFNIKLNINFLGNKKPKYNEYCTSLSLVLSKSVVKTDNDYYSQMFLE